MFIAPFLHLLTTVDLAFNRIVLTAFIFGEVPYQPYTVLDLSHNQLIQIPVIAGFARVVSVRQQSQCFFALLNCMCVCVVLCRLKEIPFLAPLAPEVRLFKHYCCITARLMHAMILDY